MSEYLLVGEVPLPGGGKFSLLMATAANPGTLLFTVNSGRWWPGSRPRRVLASPAQRSMKHMATLATSPQIYIL